MPSQDDNRILVTSSTIIDGKKIDLVYSLDKEWSLLHASYYTEEDGTTKRVEISETQQKELVEKVQTELNRFIGKMKQKLNE